MSVCVCVYVCVADFQQLAATEGGPHRLHLSPAPRSTDALFSPTVERFFAAASPTSSFEPVNMHVNIPRIPQTLLSDPVMPGQRH